MNVNRTINVANTNATSNSGMTITVLSGVFIILLLIAGFAIYYETIGYYFDLGWKRLRWSHEKDETIQIQIPGSSILAELEPTNLEKDVEIALGGNRPQVFNIARNIYNYHEAEPLCKAFGAELATYEQVKESYDRGADWCNYGWSKGQLALYPTQQETYDKLQHEGRTEEERDSCGVPGVNGGYFPNPDQKFGVNCYGIRPAETALDKHESKSITPEETEFEREVHRFHAELPNIPVNPFARHRWSE